MIDVIFDINDSIKVVVEVKKIDYLIIVVIHLINDKNFEEKLKLIEKVVTVEVSVSNDDVIFEVFVYDKHRIVIVDVNFLIEIKKNTGHKDVRVIVEVRFTIIINVDLKNIIHS